ncbi:MAG: hypothetical protein ACE5JH_06205 [Acidobacteriota bacterium]
MPGPEPAPPGAPEARHPLVERILNGNAPDTIRLTAARGSLPIPAHDLLYLQVCLLKDPVPEVVREAEKSLQKTSMESLALLFREAHCDPLLIDYFVRTGKLTGPALEAAIFHQTVAESTLEWLAASGSSEALSLIVTNEARIIGNPRLLELLRGNPRLSGEGRRRLLELERDFVGKEKLTVREAPATAPPETAPPGAPGHPAGEAPAEEAAAEAPPELTPEAEASYEETLRRTPAFQRIMRMNVPERQQLAMKGNAEDRAILIRDTAKTVSLQVLKSPKLNEQEITAFANMRNVCEDVLRIIGSHRDWTKSYGVAHALVRNPKTPPGVSVQFLPRLGTRDLKQVAGDKNVPELLRRQARNLFLARTQPPKKLKKKGH